MMQLYIKQGCQFCGKVLNKIEELNAKDDFELIHAEEGTEGRDTVIKLGGKSMVPFLVDGDTHMYESDDIVEYISKKFS